MRQGKDSAGINPHHFPSFDNFFLFEKCDIAINKYKAPHSSPRQNLISLAVELVYLFA